MARRRGKKKIAVAFVPHIDATPERLAKGDHSEWVNPAEIDPTEQAINRVRRFRPDHLSRLYRAGCLTHSQYAAGDWYRTTYIRMNVEPKVVASYGERTTGGIIDYGLPRTDAQIKARERFRAARSLWARNMLGFMDRLLLRNYLPHLRGRAQMRNLEEIKRGLTDLAAWLKLP